MTSGQRHRLPALFCAFALAGCASSGDWAYESTGEKNLHIEAKVLANSFTTARAAFLYLYEIGPRCQRTYLGTVTLDKPTIDIGLPKDKLLLLTAEFAEVGRFNQSSTRNVYSYLLQPRQGYDYAAFIQQQERLYKFSLTERRHGSATSHAIERKGLEHCAPTS